MYLKPAGLHKSGLPQERVRSSWGVSTEQVQQKNSISRSKDFGKTFWGNMSYCEKLEGTENRTIFFQVGVTTWSIIPVSKWLITMVSKSPKKGLNGFEMGVTNHLLTGMILQATSFSASASVTPTCLDKNYVLRFMPGRNASRTALSAYRRWRFRGGVGGRKQGGATHELGERFLRD